jgi:hypothetical protein
VKNPVANLVVVAVVAWAAVGGLMDACLFEGNHGPAPTTPAVAATAATGSVPNADLRDPNDLPGYLLYRPNPAREEYMSYLRMQNRRDAMETMLWGGQNGPRPLTTR